MNEAIVCAPLELADLEQVSGGGSASLAGRLAGLAVGTFGGGALALAVCPAVAAASGPLAPVVGGACTLAITVGGMALGTAAGDAIGHSLSDEGGGAGRASTDMSGVDAEDAHAGDPGQSQSSEKEDALDVRFDADDTPAPPAENFEQPDLTSNAGDYE